MESTRDSRSSVRKTLSPADIEKLRTSDPNLRILDLEDGKIQATSLIDALSTNSTLQSLNLKGTTLNAKDAEKLGMTMVSRGLHLEELNVSSNKLESDGAKAIIDAAAKSGTIRSLDLEKNNIAKDGLRTIGLTLKSTRLQSLSLKYAISSKSLI
jgi:hypothetical protein